MIFDRWYTALWPFHWRWMYSGNKVLLNILQPFLCKILQTSHTSIIFSATSIASFINGTGIKVLQSATTLRPVSRWLWYTVLWWEWPPGGYQTIPGLQDVRQRDGKIRTYPLTAALEFVSITRSSTEVHSFVVEAIVTSSISGSSWTQKCVREMAG